MTCEEVRSYISDKNHLENADAAEHMTNCVECRQFVEAEDTLASQLNLARENAPEIPAWLDAAVMQAYRREMDHERKSPIRKGSLIPRFAWAVVVAAVVLAVVLFASHRKPETIANRPVIDPQPVQTQQSPKPVADKVPDQPKPVVAKRHSHLGRPHERQAATPVLARETPADGFQNLMYCDPLSCAGPMQVIRIQLPVSDLQRIPVARRNNGLVQADVVVGSDGVARAIRIVR